MGMFDTVQLLGPDAAKTPCAAGHPCTSFQTKDLECAMDDYVVLEAKLYLVERLSDEREDSTPEFEDGRLILRSARTGTASVFTGNVHIYTRCGLCDPVFVESGGSTSWDALHAHEPPVEYELSIREGRVYAVAPVKVCTREQLRADLVRQGSLVLPDDDRIVKRHLERLRAEGTKRRALR